MSYRGDHDAALARADALERQLAEARAQVGERDARVSELERELATARTALARVEPAEVAAAKRDQSLEPAEEPMSTAGLLVALGGAVVCVAGLFAGSLVLILGGFAAFGLGGVWAGLYR